MGRTVLPSVLMWWRGPFPNATHKASQLPHGPCPGGVPPPCWVVGALLTCDCHRVVSSLDLLTPPGGPQPLAAVHQYCPGAAAWWVPEGRELWAQQRPPSVGDRVSLPAPLWAPCRPSPISFLALLPEPGARGAWLLSQPLACPPSSCRGLSLGLPRMQGNWGRGHRKCFPSSDHSSSCGGGRGAGEGGCAPPPTRAQPGPAPDRQKGSYFLFVVDPCGCVSCVGSWGPWHSPP